MPLPGFFRSLRFRLLFASLLIQFVFISLIIGNSLRLVDAHLHQHVDEHIQSAQSLYQTALAAPLANRDYATAHEILASLQRDSDLDYLMLVTPDGQRLAGTAWKTEQPLPQAGRDPVNPELMHVILPIELYGQHYADLHYGISLRFIAQTRHDLIVQSAVISFGGILLSLLALGLSGYWLTRHLSTLAATSQRIAAGESGVTVDAGSNDELRQVSAAFNDMSRSLQVKATLLEREVHISGGSTCCGGCG